MYDPEKIPLKGYMLYIDAARRMKKDGLVLSDVSVLLLLAMHSNADGWCKLFPYTMSRELGVSVRTIVRSVDSLARLGIVDVIRRKGDVAINGANEYKLILEVMKRFFEETPVSDRKVTRVRSKTTACVTSPRHACLSLRTWKDRERRTE